MNIHVLQILRFSYILRPNIVLRFVPVASEAAICYYAVHLE